MDACGQGAPYRNPRLCGSTTKAGDTFSNRGVARPPPPAPPQAGPVGTAAKGEWAMDPITAAIMAVLPALAGDTVKAAVKDAYDGLKAVIRRKWGESAPISKVIAAIEDPDSKAQKAVLEEKVDSVKAA